MMIRTRLLFAAVIALLALGGCASADPTASSSTAGAAGDTGDSRSLPKEFDRPYVATEVTGAHSIVPGSEIFLRLDSNGTLLGTAGCAGVLDSYTLAGNVLSTPLSSEPRDSRDTRGCFDERDAAQDPRIVGLVMDQEIWFVTFLGSSPTVTFDNGTLTLTNGTDTMVMTEAPGSLGAVGGAKTLEGTGWRLGAVIAPGIFRPIGATISAWARFDGTDVAFGSQCNRGGASAQTTDDSITFGALNIAANSCEAPITGNTDGGLSFVFTGTTTYFLQGSLNSTLTITSQDGSASLQFFADPTAGTGAFTDSSVSDGIAPSIN